MIVVDNTAGDEGTEAVAREFDATYVVEPVRGVSRARNRGMSESNSEIVAYVDDDVTFDVQWLGQILGPFSDPQVAVVAGRVVTPQSATESSARQTVRYLNNEDPDWFEAITFGGFLFESNMAFRRKACNGHIVFDERLGRGAPFEIGEGQFALAYLLTRGYTAVYLDYAVVCHGPFKFDEVKREARNRVALWMLLFSEFPGRRFYLLRFLLRRIRRKPLTWPRDAADPGEIITSGWQVLLAASFRGALLFFRTRKPKKR